MNKPQSRPAYSEAAKTLSPALIAVAVLLMAVIGIEIWTWIFAGSNAEEIAFRSGVVRNMGLLAVGVIGLPLAIWRSYTAHKQAEEAAKQGIRTDKQLKLTSEQMKITTESNHVDLLERSTALLGLDDEKKRETAVSFLTTLGEDKGSKYAPTAQQLLTSIIDGQECDGVEPQYIARTLQWMEKYSKENNSEFFVHNVRWKNNAYSSKLFEHVAGITYVDGHYKRICFDDFYLYEFKDNIFEDCFIDCVLYMRGSIKIIDSRIGFFPIVIIFETKVIFNNCDFTNCTIDEFQFINFGLTIKNCFFLEGSPPEDSIFYLCETEFTALSATDYAERTKGRLSSKDIPTL